jgi:hypothetical protein
MWEERSLQLRAAVTILANIEERKPAGRMLRQDITTGLLHVVIPTQIALITMFAQPQVERHHLPSQIRHTAMQEHGREVMLEARNVEQ